MTAHSLKTSGSTRYLTQARTIAHHQFGPAFHRTHDIGRMNGAVCEDQWKIFNACIKNCLGDCAVPKTLLRMLISRFAQPNAHVRAPRRKTLPEFNSTLTCSVPKRCRLLGTAVRLARLPARARSDEAQIHWFKTAPICAGSILL